MAAFARLASGSPSSRQVVRRPHRGTFVAVQAHVGVGSVFARNWVGRRASAEGVDGARGTRFVVDAFVHERQPANRQRCLMIGAVRAQRAPRLLRLLCVLAALPLAAEAVAMPSEASNPWSTEPPSRAGTGPSPSLASGRSSAESPAGPRRSPMLAPGWLERAAQLNFGHARPLALVSRSAHLVTQQGGPAKRNWIGRHPVLVGALVGFGGGFLVGYLPGDDGVFYDFTAEFNGFVLGGVGAGLGAIVGAVASK